MATRRIIASLVSRRFILFRHVAFLLAFSFLNGCGLNLDGESVDLNVSLGGLSPALDGAELYATNCAACHNPLEQTSKKDRDKTAIENSIKNVSLMSHLSRLSEDEIKAIAKALSSEVVVDPPVEPEPIPGPPAPPEPLDGAQLYALNCTGCHHNPLATTQLTNRTRLQIENAITTYPQMNGLSRLSVAELDAIVAALKDNTVPDPDPNPPPPPPPGPLNGAELYANNCTGCHHNPLATTQLTNRTRLQIENAITTYPQMNGLSRLSVAELDAIVAALEDNTLPDPPPPPPPGPLNGAELYALNCTGCHHNPLATTQLTNRTRLQIENAITTYPPMNGLSRLSVAELDAIVAALEDNTLPDPPPPPPPGPIDGAQLYQNRCAECHGDLSVSDKIGASDTLIQRGIDTKPAMAGLSDLTSDEVLAISRALVAPSGPDSAVFRSFGNRYVVSDRFRRFFFLSGQDALNTNLDSLIAKYIKGRYAEFGGLCQINDPDCPVSRTAMFSAAVVDDKGAANVLRRGYMIKACDTVIQNAQRVKGVVERFNRVYTTRPTWNDFKYFADRMKIGFVPDQNVRNAFDALEQKFINENIGAAAAWKLMFTPLCYSMLMEVQ